jgi:hypothetical protein
MTCVTKRVNPRFEDKGWVDLVRERIRIVDRIALEALAAA